jgi:predicted RND superfamily exporter protein
MNVMNDEFLVAPPNARVMIRDVTVPKALEYKQKISEVEGVDEIDWLDDAVNINVPLEMIPGKTLDSWYKDGSALFTLTIDDSRRDSALAGIRNIIGTNGAMSGQVVNLASAMQSSGQEVSKMTYFLIPIVLIILLLTTTSWFEPLLFLASIGIAIILNLGTNAILGEISFVTKTAAAILQLAVSLDYSIFLLHRFAEFRREGQSVQDAMRNAMVKSFSSILASGLTTVIGFVALIFMSFKIGPDMGIVMAKSIIFSLLSVLVFLPVLATASYKLIDKTHHRPFIPSFGGFARFVIRIGIPLLAVFVLMIGPSYLAQNKNSFSFGASGVFGDESTQVGRENAEINDVFGRYSTMVLMVPKGELADEKALYNNIKDIKQVTSVVSYIGSVGAEIPMEFVPEQQLSKLVSKHDSRMVITLDSKQEGDEAIALVEQMRDAANKYYPGSYYLAGDSVNAYDMKDTVTKDSIVVNAIAIGSIFIILLLTFRSLSLPLLLLIAIETAIWINLSIPYFSGNSLFYIASLIVSSVQLGATVDYAILFSNRYIENRGVLQRREAVTRTVSDTAVSILTSSFILFSGGTIMGIISSNAVTSQIGTIIGRGAILSAASVLLVLPTLLLLLDKVVEKTTLHIHFKH